jgi:hypothetical protein
MANVHELKPTEEQRLSMADQNFLSWLEMTSALPHAHIHAVFDDVSVPEIIALFMDHANKMGSQFGNCRYMSVMYGSKNDDE